jgi:hypothetical protein
MKWIHDLRAAGLRRTSPWRAALADLPAGLESYWRASAPREYFDAVRHSGRPCALPSEAADAVWHAWLRWNPVSLERFCVRHFGAAVPHVERAALAGNALLHTYAACCARDGVTPGGLRLPALFGLDARLRMPRGHGYWNRGDEVRYARLNERGRGMWRACPHPELAPAALFAAGLVDRHVLEAHLRRREAVATAGSSCGGDVAFAGSDACADGGGGSGDGGCDGGGSGCGSSCGSGCGGGGD